MRLNLPDRLTWFFFGLHVISPSHETKPGFPRLHVIMVLGKHLEKRQKVVWSDLSYVHLSCISHGISEIKSSCGWVPPVSGFKVSWEDDKLKLYSGLSAKPGTKIPWVSISQLGLMESWLILPYFPYVSDSRKKGSLGLIYITKWNRQIST